MTIERAAFTDELIPASRGVSIPLKGLSETLTPKREQTTSERAALSNALMFDISRDWHHVR